MDNKDITAPNNERDILRRALDRYGDDRSSIECDHDRDAVHRRCVALVTNVDVLYLPRRRHMMEYLRKLLRQWWPTRKEEPSFEFAIENCGLSTEQIHLARCTLHALGMHEQSDGMSLEDLVFLCYSVGMNPPEYVIEAKLRALGLASVAPYAFVHFLHLWHALLENQDEEEGILERAFNFFDKDGNGEISTAEFKTTMKELGNLLSEAEMDEFLGLMDTNRDGAIDYGEFIRLLKCQRPVYMDLADKTSHDGDVTAGLKTNAFQEIPSDTAEERSDSTEAETRIEEHCVSDVYT